MGIPQILWERSTQCLRAKALTLWSPSACDVAAHHHRERGLRIAHDHKLRIVGIGELLRGFDALPLEQRRRDALGDDALEVGDARGLDLLPVRLLLLLLQDELHSTPDAANFS